MIGYSMCHFIISEQVTVYTCVLCKEDCLRCSQWSFIWKFTKAATLSYSCTACPYRVWIMKCPMYGSTWYYIYRSYKFSFQCSVALVAILRANTVLLRLVLYKAPQYGLGSGCSLPELPSNYKAISCLPGVWAGSTDLMEAMGFKLQ